MLSLNELQNIVMWINSQKSGDIMTDHTSSIPNLSSKEVSLKLLRFLTAAQCLYKLEKFEDCLGLLDLILSLEDIHSSYSGYSTFRQLDTSCKVNPIASIFYVAGKCFDALENRLEAIRYLALSIKIDPACLHSLDYLLEKKMLTDKEKKDLYDQLPLLNGHLEYLNHFYR